MKNKKSILENIKYADILDEYILAHENYSIAFTTISYIITNKTATIELFGAPICFDTINKLIIYFDVTKLPDADNLLLFKFKRYKNLLYKEYKKYIKLNLHKHYIVI